MGLTHCVSHATLQLYATRATATHIVGFEDRATTAAIKHDDDHYLHAPFARPPCRNMCCCPCHGTWNHQDFGILNTKADDDKIINDVCYRKNSQYDVR